MRNLCFNYGLPSGAGDTSQITAKREDSFSRLRKRFGFARSFLVGLTIIGFLVAVFPSNIYAAIRRTDFGRHAAGPRYLLARAPLQLLLIFWTYWFVLRGSR